MNRACSIDTQNPSARMRRHVGDTCAAAGATSCPTQMSFAVYTLVRASTS